MIAIKAVIPKKVDIPAMNKAWLDELSKYGKFIVKDFENVVAPWSGEKPAFQLARYLDTEGVKLIVRVVGPEEGRKKWIWLNEGTKPHTIRAKNAKTLAFPSVYHAGSRPGSARTFKGSSGGTTVFAPEVQHPGTEKRDFSGVIAKDHEKPFQSWMQNAASRVAEASGHAI